MFDALIKVGGSLCNNPELPNFAAEWGKLAAAHRLLLLPGGGAFADQVRVVDARLKLSDSAAHWMAILAMDQNAHLLADLIPDAVLVDSLEAAATVGAGKKAAVLAPSALLRALDPLPHSWQITSDSIAAWLAAFANIQRLILLKSVGGVYPADAGGQPAEPLAQVSSRTLTNNPVVDGYFAQTLSPATQCWLLNGLNPERLVELLEKERTTETRITGEMG